METDKIQETLVIRGNKLTLEYSGVLRARAPGWKDEWRRVGAARPDHMWAYMCVWPPLGRRMHSVLVSANLDGRRDKKSCV